MKNLIIREFLEFIVSVGQFQPNQLALDTSLKQSVRMYDNVYMITRRITVFRFLLQY